MASGISPVPPPSPSRAARSKSSVVEYDRYIDAQLRKTRGYVRSVDVTSALLSLAVAWLGYLFVVALADHWVIAGGLGFWARVVLFALLIGGTGYFLIRRVLPLFLWKINPVYAADAIERSRPLLKNALINFLLLRSHRDTVSESVFGAVEQQAATGLAKVPVDAAVDRSKLIRIGYVLLAVLFFCALYKVVSPKDPLRTAARVLMPWADIQPPTRVAIRDVRPGMLTALRGQVIHVSAEVGGLAPDENVTLYYTTADGQLVEKPLKMILPSAGYRHECEMPAGGEGIQQSLDYRIAAGDATTKLYHVEVVAAPTMVVEKVRYEYPEYMQRRPHEIEHQGDIKDLEGTTVTIHALANHEIARAYIDFDCDGTDDQRMIVKGTHATASFQLALAQDRTTPEHSSYRLRFMNTQRQDNLQPIRHQIYVTPDLAPEISFLAPTDENVEVPENSAVELELSASDPDFGLAKVIVRQTQAGNALPDKVLFDGKPQRQFGQKFSVVPRELGLKAGDVLEYWGVADDNKTPQPNRSETKKRTIQVIEAAQSQQKKPGAGAGQQDEQQPGQRGDSQTRKRPGAPNRQDRGKPEDAGKQDGSENKEKRDGQSDNGSEESAQDKQPGGKNDRLAARDQNRQDQDKNSNRGQEGERRPADQPSPDEQDGASEPVPSDGSNDVSAIKRILEHREEQAGGEENKTQSGEQNGQDNPQQRDDKQGGQDQEQQKDEGQGGQDGSAESQKQPRDDGSKAGENPGQEKQPGAQGNNQGGQDGGQPGAKGGQEQGGGQSQKNGSGDKSGSPKSNDGSRSSSKNGQGGQQPGKATGAQNRQGKNAAGGDSANQSSGQKPGAQRGQESSGDPQKPDGAQGPQDAGLDKEGARGTPKPEAGSKSPGKEADNPADQGGDANNQQGKGGQSKGQAEPKDGEPKGKQTPDSKGGDPEHDLGEPGAGQQSGDKQGSSGPINTPRPRPKSKPGTPGQQRKSEGAPSTPSEKSKTQSDSEGATDGDRAGGGSDGGGQKADSQGTGGAGSHTAADEGSGQSAERGKGDTSGRSGSDQEAKGSTGKQGNKAGQGSAGDKQAGGQQSAGGKGSSQQAGEGENSQQGRPGPGEPRGSGGLGSGPSADTAPQQTQKEKADDPNLNYARKATELALEHLKDQLDKKKADHELLNKLGWTEQDAQAFLRRWQQMRAAAGRDDSKNHQARQELDETLRSLGLRPRGARLDSGTARDDQARGLKETRRTSPPPEYAEQYKVYKQGTASGTR